MITIDGENPAHIHVGDSYSDLGVRVTDNVDKNLGIKTYLNGALVSDIMIDTSAVATDTIDYVATDQSGLTSTSTRAVIIEAAQSADAPPLAPTDTPEQIPANASVDTGTDNPTESATQQ